MAANNFENGPTDGPTDGTNVKSQDGSDSSLQTVHI